MDAQNAGTVLDNVCRQNESRNKSDIDRPSIHWAFDSCIEPTDPSYGKGYGLLYL